MMGGNAANMVKSKDAFAFCRFQKHEPSKDFAGYLLSLSYSLGITSKTMIKSSDFGHKKVTRVSLLAFYNEYYYVFNRIVQYCTILST